MDPKFSFTADFDDRIVSGKPVATINKSNGSISSTAYSAQTSSTNRLNFSVACPRGVYVDRQVLLEADLSFSMNVTITNPTGNAAIALGHVANNTAPHLPAVAAGPKRPVIVLGRDLAIRPYAFHKLFDTISVKINSESFSQDAAEVQDKFDLLLESSGYDKEGGNICPVSVPKFAVNHFVPSTCESAMRGAYYSSENGGSNGSYHNIRFLNPNGEELKITPDGDPHFQDAVGNVPKLTLVEFGVPYQSPDVNDPLTVGTALEGRENYTIRVKVHICEPLRVSPFCFNRGNTSTGLFGVDTINVSIALNNDVSKFFMSARAADNQIFRNVNHDSSAIPEVRAQVRQITDMKWLNANAIQNAQLIVTTIQPPLSLEIPPLNIIPYQDILQNISTHASRIGQDTKKTAVITSQPIPLSEIPQMVMLSVQPETYSSNHEVNPFYMPIESIQVKFDSSSSQLSNFTREQLYQMTYENGIKLDYNTFCGNAYGGYNDGLPVHMLGSPVLLKFGKDICLPEELASGVAGSFIVSFQVAYKSPIAALEPTAYTDTSAINYTRDLGGVDNANVMNFGNCKLSTQLFTGGYLVTSSLGKSMKISSVFDKGDVLKQTLNLKQSMAMPVAEMVGSGIFDKFKKGASKLGKFTMNKVLPFLGREAADIGSAVKNRLGPKLIDKVGDKMLDRMMGSGGVSASVIGGGTQSKNILEKLY